MKTRQVNILAGFTGKTYFATEEQIEAVVKILAAEEEVSGVWKPKEGEAYYCVDFGGYIESYIWNGNKTEESFYTIGNCFKTYEEAQAKKDYDIALNTIKRDAGGFVPDWEDGKQDKWHGYYSHGNLGLHIDSTHMSQRQGVVHFETYKAVEQSQKTHRAEWLRILNIKEEK